MVIFGHENDVRELMINQWIQGYGPMDSDRETVPARSQHFKDAGYSHCRHVYMYIYCVYIYIVYSVYIYMCYVMY